MLSDRTLTILSLWPDQLLTATTCLPSFEMSDPQLCSICNTLAKGNSKVHLCNSCMKYFHTTCGRLKTTTVIQIEQCLASIEDQIAETREKTQLRRFFYSNSAKNEYEIPTPTPTAPDNSLETRGIYCFRSNLRYRHRTNAFR